MVPLHNSSRCLTTALAHTISNASINAFSVKNAYTSNGYLSGCSAIAALKASYSSFAESLLCLASLSIVAPFNNSLKSFSVNLKTLFGFPFNVFKYGHHSLPFAFALSQHNHNANCTNSGFSSINGETTGMFFRCPPATQLS